MRAVSPEEISQGQRAVRRTAGMCRGMLALQCSHVALDKAPMVWCGQAKQGIRPDLEVGLNPMVTGDGRVCRPGALLRGAPPPGSRSALSARAGTGLRR